MTQQVYPVYRLKVGRTLPKGWCCHWKDKAIINREASIWIALVDLPLIVLHENTKAIGLLFWAKSKYLRENTKVIGLLFWAKSKNNERFEDVGGKPCLPHPSIVSLQTKTFLIGISASAHIPPKPGVFCMVHCVSCQITSTPCFLLAHNFLHRLLQEVVSCVQILT